MLRRRNKTTTSHLAQLRFDSGLFSLSDFTSLLRDTTLLAIQPCVFFSEPTAPLRALRDKGPAAIMASLGRAMRRLGSSWKLSSTGTASTDSLSLISTEAPQVNLPHVDTQLNMHQYNGFFEDGSSAADGLRVADSHSSPSQPFYPSASPNSNESNNGEAPTEWSAVGHAATGKSGRVIHNLQEEIARLTRECSLYRSRAEETQRSNETYKIQVQNMTERLRNLEQVNETNLNSIARKDRKLDELRAELQTERTKRQQAEADANTTNQTMRDERENHNREQARSQEIAKYHETQYEVLAGTTKRDKAELARRVRVLHTELQSMAEAQKTQDVNTDRLMVIADQKNREMESLKEVHEKLMTSHVDYKKTKDNELRDTIERTHNNNAMIDAALESIRETEAQMRWAIMLHENREREKREKEGKETEKDTSDA
ncbi:hypothetical protein N7462_000639 [Penicillium macrosclerotiorum]|uniref:uncharacterized protein n=1 Tax=Penicillium macrosclerotiorum TaxID=303699 RepID=UPI002546CDFA|nr:uncharacterized protein N7462_000639 [Penicillium macrosclerotiorum]KAJ5698634.1 hypothetical protein N7462_000639 [Penicillium macrosclerotiorum]